MWNTSPTMVSTPATFTTSAPAAIHAASTIASAVLTGLPLRTLPVHMRQEHHGSP